MAIPKRRNRTFQETHRALLEAAARLVARKGVEALALAEVAREAGFNRATVYYHFPSREALLAEVKAWSAEQLAEAFNPGRPREERIEHIYRFVLANPELIKLWLDDLLQSGDIRAVYPHWDELVAGIRRHCAEHPQAPRVDVEVFCVNLLLGAFLGPRVFKESVCPGADDAVVVERFKAESLRLLASLDLV
ncbi:MAG: hypothetical protein KatS3mg124_0177 [Porticoccaceae bacterium]|nr:MAG: hypothetical protein KatS3mg124_0177 [Porticoccaceae bacterium]